MRVGDAAVVQRLLAEGRWCRGGIGEQVAEHDDFADAGQTRCFEHIHVNERTAHVLTRWMAAAVGDSACRRGRRNTISAPSSARCASSNRRNRAWRCGAPGHPTG